MRLLLELGADPFLPNLDNSTALMAAAGLGTRSPGEDAGTEEEVIEAVQVALDHGLDINAVDKNGETAMHGAAYKNLPKAVEFLNAKGAKVEVWHANHLGNYSYFDKSQSAFNLRRTIVTDAQGRYKFRSIMPVGYSVPPGGSTDILLTLLGRHGHRPAHIHFFAHAEGKRKLTTQINIETDPHLWDDFAFGTREGLVPPVKTNSDPAAMAALGTDKPFFEIEFNFDMQPLKAEAPVTDFARPRAAA